MNGLLILSFCIKSIFPIKWISLFILNSYGTYFSITCLLYGYQRIKFTNHFIVIDKQYLYNLHPKKLNYDHSVFWKFPSKEILLLYYIGSIKFLILSSISNQIIPFSIILIINIFIVPIAIYNLYKYRRNIYHISYLWTNFFVILQTIIVITNIFDTLTLNYSLLLIFFFSFTIPLTAWILIKPKLINYYLMRQQIKYLKKYKHSSIIRQLLKSSPLITNNRSIYDIYCGECNANTQITLYLSPIHLPSGYVFQFLREIVKKNENTKLIIKFISLGNPSSTYLIRLFLHYSLIHSKEDTLNLIGNWFLDSSKDINVFKNIYKIEESNLQIVDKIIESHVKQSKEIKKITSPTILINNRVIPQYFDLEDISNLISTDPMRIQPFAETVKEKFWKDRRPFFLDN